MATGAERWYRRTHEAAVAESGKRYPADLLHHDTGGPYQ